MPPISQGLCLASPGYFGPFLRLHLLGEATSTLFHHLFPLWVSFPLLVNNLLLGIMSGRKRGEFSLSGYLWRFSPNLRLYHLHEAGLRFALYPHVFLCLTHFDKRGVARTFGRNFWRWKAIEDFEIIFEFREVNYLFLLLDYRL